MMSSMTLNCEIEPQSPVPDYDKMLKGRAPLTTKGSASLPKRRSNIVTSMKALKPETSFRSSLFQGISFIFQ